MFKVGQHERWVLETYSCPDSCPKHFYNWNGGAMLRMQWVMVEATGGHNRVKMKVSWQGLLRTQKADVLSAISV